MQDNAIITGPIVKEFSLKRGAELGVKEGALTKALLHLVQDLTMVCVDTWKEHANITSSYEHEDNYTAFVSNMKPYMDRIRIHRDLTTEAHKHIIDGSLDFIYIDATRTYDAFSVDYDAWISKVKPGGMVMGRGYSSKIDKGGLVKAINEKVGIPISLEYSKEPAFTVESLVEHLRNNNPSGIADKQSGSWYCWKRHAITK
jgi:hypothetical protein